MNSKLTVKVLILAILFCSPLFLLDCVGIGSNFHSQYIPQIQIGKTTILDVKQLFDEPNQSDSSHRIIDSQIDHYYYRRWGGYTDQSTSKFINIEYIRDTVNGFIYNNSWDELSTEFNQEKADHFIVNKTSRSEAIAALGNQFGEFLFPSNLILWILGEEDLSQCPKVYKHGIVYEYIYSTEVLSGNTLHAKKLLLLFDENDILIYKWVYPSVSPDKQFPNPFSPSALIDYNNMRDQHVLIVLFDQKGNAVDTLVNKIQPAGQYKLKPNFAKYESGLYFYRFSNADTSYNKKLYLMK